MSRLGKLVLYLVLFALLVVILFRWVFPWVDRTFVTDPTLESRGPAAVAAA